jgi:hypothetical protein
MKKKDACDLWQFLFKKANKTAKLILTTLTILAAKIMSQKRKIHHLSMNCKAQQLQQICSCSHHIMNDSFSHKKRKHTLLKAKKKASFKFSHLTKACQVER